MYSALAVSGELENGNRDANKPPQRVFLEQATPARASGACAPRTGARRAVAHCQCRQLPRRRAVPAAVVGGAPEQRAALHRSAGTMTCWVPVCNGWLGSSHLHTAVRAIRIETIVRPDDRMWGSWSRCGSFVSSNRWSSDHSGLGSSVPSCLGQTVSSHTRENGFSQPGVAPLRLEGHILQEQAEVAPHLRPLTRVQVLG